MWRGGCSFTDKVRRAQLNPNPNPNPNPVTQPNPNPNPNQVTRAHVSTARYPGYPDSVQAFQPHMVAHLSETGGMLSLTATITGIEPSATGGDPPPHAPLTTSRPPPAW